MNGQLERIKNRNATLKAAVAEAGAKVVETEGNLASAVERLGEYESKNAHQKGLIAGLELQLEKFNDMITEFSSPFESLSLEDRVGIELRLKERTTLWHSQLVEIKGLHKQGLIEISSLKQIISQHAGTLAEIL